MRLTPQEEYGLRCLLQVARLAPDDRVPPVSIERIADAEGLGYEHAAKILRLLRHGDLVASTRGVHGGYHLARPARVITVWDALVALDDPLYDASFCEAFTGRLAACTHATSACTLKALWRHVGASLEQILSRVTIADLMEGHAATAPEPAPFELARGAP